jgi:hypothetical protein
MTSFLGWLIYTKWGWRRIEQYTDSGKPRVLKSQPFTKLHPVASILTYTVIAIKATKFRVAIFERYNL